MEREREISNHGLNECVTTSPYTCSTIIYSLRLADTVHSFVCSSRAYIPDYSHIRHYLPTTHIRHSCRRIRLGEDCRLLQSARAQRCRRRRAQNLWHLHSRKSSCHQHSVTPPFESRVRDTTGEGKPTYTKDTTSVHLYTRMSFPFSPPRWEKNDDPHTFVALHFSPSNTGQLPCLLPRSSSPLAVMLQKSNASPSLAST